MHRARSHSAHNQVNRLRSGGEVQNQVLDLRGVSTIREVDVPGSWSRDSRGRKCRVDRKLSGIDDGLWRCFVILRSVRRAGKWRPRVRIAWESLDALRPAECHSRITGTGTRLYLRMGGPVRLSNVGCNELWLDLRDGSLRVIYGQFKSPSFT